ncbi:hypothetical protein [Pontibacter sp. BAB1700]|uniref:hypothetical protein n=1 Tax=Pontibacter sp. BAB1700 TaxID=1144253 RepID=UPI00026BE949|nr:hypothetical protein [Pontibacter sp. BAB1700]EJF09323.1 hypothetical protein O71_15730 [Pontibacter sp. BAB1700]
MKKLTAVFLLGMMSFLISCKKYEIKPEHKELNKVSNFILLMPAKVLSPSSVELTFILRDENIVGNLGLVLQIAYEEDNLTGIYRRTPFEEYHFSAEQLKKQQNKATVFIEGISTDRPLYARVRNRSYDGKDSNLITFKL